MLRNSDKLVVLAVNNNSDQQFAIRQIIREDHPEAIIKSVFSGTELINYFLRAGNYSSSIDEVPNIILLDNKLPDISGIEALYEIRNDNNFKEARVFVFGDTKTFFDARTILDIRIKGFYVIPPNAVHKISFIIKQILHRETPQVLAKKAD